MISRTLTRAGRIIPGLVAASVPGWNPGTNDAAAYNRPERTVRAVVTGRYHVAINQEIAVIQAAMAVTAISRDCKMIGAIWVAEADRKGVATTRPGASRLGDWTDAQVWRVHVGAVAQGDVTDRADLTDGEFTTWLREIATPVSERV